MSELKPCPFCGKSEVDYQGRRDAFYCHTCGACGPDDAEGNVESWNRRAAVLERGVWISVSKRLPEPEDGADFVPVLFCLRNADHPVCAGRYFPEEPKARRWVSLQGSYYPTKAITHWMPLPAAPVSYDEKLDVLAGRKRDE
jgi:Lar family restriction alleviation protein